MAKPFNSRDEIPDRLLEAKRNAASQYLVVEPRVALVGLAAHPNPRHNVVGIGIGRKIIEGKETDRPCVRFYVERKLPKAAVAKDLLLPRRIGNIVTDVIETGRFRVLPTRVPKQRERLRPAQPGCSVGFQFTGDKSNYVMAGTFGALAEAGSRRFILSNNHVLANENALSEGAPIFQPGLLDKNSPANDRIAALSKFVTLDPAAQNQVDCAIAELDNPRLAAPAVLPKVGKLTSGVPVSAAEAMRVEKTGRTTGYTTGVIRDLSADVKIQYDAGVVTFTEQILITGDGGPFSDEGDSGSMIVDRRTKQAVGLLFAGSSSHTIANHVSEVVNALGIGIVA
jgi:hypothetical protein